MRFSNYLLILSFLLLTLVFTACEKESGEPTFEAPEISSSRESFYQPNPSLYQAAGDAYRENLFYYNQDFEAGIINPVEDASEIYLGSIENNKGIIGGYVNQGSIDDLDQQKLYEFNNAIPDLGLTSNTTLLEGRAIIESWMTENAVTAKDFPLTYHTILIAIESLFENQITKLQKSDPGIILKGANDNTLCTVSGLFCTRTNAVVSGAAQAALALGYRQYFSSLTNWTTLQQNAAVAAIALILNTFWDDIFCNEDCDDCAPAAGIRAVYNGCNFTGIQAVGSFEFAEEWEYFIDRNQDGTTDQIIPQRTNAGFVPKTSLPATGFKVFVDIKCDGGLQNQPGSVMPWPASRLAPVYVDPRLSVAPPRPTANFTQPALQGSPYPYFYNTNTQLCFGMTNLATRGWTFVGWRTSTGGSPSTGNYTSSFCTSFNASQATTASVYAEFSHPCSSTNYRLPGPSFVVCPPGTCN